MSLVSANGRRGATEVVPSSLIADIAGNGDREAWRHGEFAPAFAGRQMSYRNGWYVFHHAPELMFAMGIHGQNLFVDRVNELVIAKVSSQSVPIDYALSALTYRAVAELVRLLS